MNKPDYLFINSNFKILARRSTIRYGNSQEHGEAKAGAVTLQGAIRLAQRIFDESPYLYPYGVRVSEEAVMTAKINDEVSLWESPVQHSGLTPSDFDHEEWEDSAYEEYAKFAMMFRS